MCSSDLLPVAAGNPSAHRGGGLGVPLEDDEVVARQVSMFISSVGVRGVLEEREGWCVCL